jgi:hypothetical protein
MATHITRAFGFYQFENDYVCLMTRICLDDNCVFKSTKIRQNSAVRILAVRIFAQYVLSTEGYGLREERKV